MTKYKLVGSGNLFFGILEVWISSNYLIVVLPRLAELNHQFDANVISFFPMFILLMLFLTGILNLFFGLELVSKLVKDKSKYFKYGSILLVLSFLIFGFSIAMIVFNAILSSHIHVFKIS